MTCVSTWIFASAKSTSWPFIQIFLTSSNGIEKASWFGYAQRSGIVEPELRMIEYRCR
jgi:hypothetical protein